MPTNDNESMSTGALPPPVEGHGRAALLLVESLLHGLCEKSALSAGEALEIAERAVVVQREQIEGADETHPAMGLSHSLLYAIMTSLRTDTLRGGDGAGGEGPPRLGA